MLSVPDQFDIHDAVRVLICKLAHIGGEIDPPAVDAIDLIPREKVAFIGTSGKKVFDDGAGKATDGGIQDHEQEKAKEIIHEGPGGEDDQPSDHALIAESAGIAGALLLPLHGTEAAHGKGAERVIRLPLLNMQQSGAHADGKFNDLYAACLGRQKMSQLMDENNDTERKDRN